MKNYRAFIVLAGAVIIAVTLNVELASAGRQQRVKKGSLGQRGTLTPDEKYVLMRMYQEANLKKQRNTIFPLNRQDFWKLVGSTPKNYSTVVLFFDFTLQRCAKLCENALNQFHEAAYIHYVQYLNSKNSLKDSHSLFFVTVNIDKFRNELKKYEIDVMIPNFVFFPASTTSKYVPFIKMPVDFSSFLDESESIPESIVTLWISEVSGVFLNLKKFAESVNPQSKLKYVAILGVVGYIVSFVCKKQGLIKTIEDLGKINFAKIIVGAVLWLISGHMFNIIHSTPLGVYEGNSLRLISGGFREQFTAESCIVTGLYGLISMGMIRLIEMKVESDDPKKKKRQRKASNDEGPLVITIFSSITAPLTIGFLGILYMYQYKLNS